MKHVPWHRLDYVQQSYFYFPRKSSCGNVLQFRFYTLLSAPTGNDGKERRERKKERKKKNALDKKFS